MDNNTASSLNKSESDYEQSSGAGTDLAAAPGTNFETHSTQSDTLVITLEALHQNLQNQEKQLESYFKALKAQSDNQEAHFQALQALTSSLEQHMDIFKIYSAFFEDYRKTFEAHGQAITNLMENFQAVATQLQILPHLLAMINGLQDEVNSGFSFRPGTWDRNIFRSINYKQFNEYRLPETFNPDDIIIDIGAHIGSFTYACLQRQAQHIYSYEAFAENMQILQKNMEPFGQRVELNHKAVWRSDIKLDGLTYLRDEIAEHRGLGMVDIEASGLPVESIGLDEILARFEQVRLLKVDCDRSEYVVLLTSRLLNRVEAMCIEYEALAPVPEFMGLNQYPILDRAVLENFLHKQGFDTEHRPTSVPYQGFIFATRKDIKTKLWE